jgi:hypothetical protein
LVCRAVFVGQVSWRLEQGEFQEFGLDSYRPGGRGGRMMLAVSHILLLRIPFRVPCAALAEEQGWLAWRPCYRARRTRLPRLAVTGTATPAA